MRQWTAVRALALASAVSLYTASGAHAITGTDQRSPAADARGASSATPHPLTNDEVIALAKAGLGEDAIVQRIAAAADRRFDLYPVAIAILLQSGVSGNIVREMQKAAVNSRQNDQPRDRARADDGKDKSVCVALWCW